MEVKEFFERLEMIDCQIENKQAEIQMWKGIALNTTPQGESERVQTTKEPQKMANAVNRYVDLEKEIESLAFEKDECIKIIEKVEIPLFYDILHKYHIQHKKLSEIAEIKGYSYDYMRDRHLEAKKELQKVLNNLKIPTK
jgi:UV DNA damage repair endonuclease